jgi:predicted ester cyclase
MSAEENKALIRDWLRGVDTAKVDVVDDFLAAEFTDHNPPPFAGPATGPAGVRDAFNYALNAFSDFSHELLAQFADGDYVTSRILARGRHIGEFLGIPPTGKDVSMEGIAIHRVVDGKIVEHWAQIDVAGLLIQLGVLPAPQP